MRLIKGTFTGENPNTGRIKSLSDGVFAIVMTLLVLELAVPEARIVSGIPDLSNKLREMWPKFYAYILSFLVLGMYWSRHHLLYEKIERTDAFLVWLNILFLMTISLTPLSTSLLGDYREIRSAVVFYGVNLFVNNVFLTLTWWYAVARDLVDKKTGSSVVKQINVRLIMTLTLILVGVIAAFFGMRLSLYVFSAVILLMILTPVLQGFGRFAASRNRSE